MPTAGKLNPLLRQAKREGWHKWINSSYDEASVLKGFWWSAEHAAHVWEFFRKYLRHSLGEWAGQPFELQDWQRYDVLGPLFGWVHRETGFRRFKTGYIEVAKKNGKSTLAAGVGLYLFRGDGAKGAHVFSAATKREQAAIVHDEAVRMMRASPALNDGVRINRTTRVMFHEASSSSYGVITRDAKGEHGKNIHGLIGDEMHVWTDRDFWESIRYGGAARRNHLFFLITTAGIYDPSTVAWELHQYADDVLHCRFSDPDTEFFAYIRGADQSIVDTSAILDPDVHRAANPSYGVTIQPDEIAKAAQDAIRKPSERLPFCRLRLNIWTQQAEAFFDMARWDACGAEINEDDFVGRTCFAGLDLASKKDLAAWMLCFPPERGDDKYTFMTRIFCPAETAELREAKEDVPYATWGATRQLRLTPGATIQYAVIKDQIRRDYAKFEIGGIAADPWQLEYLRQELEQEGIEIHEFRQDLQHFSEPTKKLEELYLSGRMRHDSNKVLQWCARNTIPYIDGKDNVMPHKGKSKDKIDPIIAAVMALAFAMVKEDTGTVYDRRGVIAL